MPADWTSALAAIVAPGKTVAVPCFHPSPVTGSDGHWTLVVLSWPQDGKLTMDVYDSLGSEPKEEHLHIMMALCNWMKSGGVAEGLLPTLSSVHRKIAHNVQAPSVTDCGVWVLAIARNLCEPSRCGNLPAQHQINDLRLLLAAELFTCSRIDFNLHSDVGSPTPPLAGEC